MALRQRHFYYCGVNRCRSLRCRHWSGLFYVDLNLTQKVAVGGSEAQLFFNVTNLFDRWPLLVPETGLAANSTYSDMLGRQFRVGIRFKAN
jgi:hypothetical protein